MMNKEALQRIEEKTRQFLASLGYEIIEFKSLRSPEGMIIRLLVDRLEGGITIAECADLNNRLGQLFESENLIDERYILEVSSPGLDRDMTQPKDFRRVIDKRIHVFLREDIDTKLEIEGIITVVTETGIRVRLDSGSEIQIAFTKIHKAKQVI